MELPKILELLIAVGMFYFLFSTLVSIIFEWYAYKTEKRGRFLYETIHKLLHDPVNKNYGALLYSHFNLVNLRKDSNSYPQYISAEMFADTLIDVVGSQYEPSYFENDFDKESPTHLKKVTLHEVRVADPFARYVQGVASMHYSPLKSILRSFHEKTQNYPELKAHIMKWYEDYMARVSGWYKIKIKNTLIGISFMVCITLNVDSIAFIKKVSQDDQFRESLVASAERLVEERLNQKPKATPATPNDTVTKPVKAPQELTFVFGNKIIHRTLPVTATDSAYIAQINSVVKEIQGNAIPIGYTDDFSICALSAKEFAFWILGILLSTIALSFGAPFWFEVLVKAVNIRRAGIKPNA